MKLLKKVGIFALSGVIASGLVACSDDDSKNNDNIINPDPTPDVVDNQIKGVLSTEEAGEYIEDTAKELDKICNPQDQAGTVSALIAIADVFDSYYFGDTLDPALRKSLTDATRSMAKAAKAGDYLGVARAAQDISQDFTVNPYSMTGIYTPVYDAEEDEYFWTRTGKSSNSIIFRAEKDKMEVSLVMENGTWTGKFDTTDWDYDYNPETGNWEDYDIINHWTVTVPGKMTLKMVYSGQTAATAVVESNYNEGAHTFFVKASAELANIKANVHTTGNDNKIAEQCDLYIGNTRALYSLGELNGSSLCDRKKIESIAEMPQATRIEQINNMFKDASANIDVMNRIQVKSSCSSIRDLIATGDYDDENKAETDAFVRALNSSVKTNLYFGNTDYVQGTILWSAVKRNPWGYNWYEVRPMIKLASGGSPMEFGDLLETGMLDQAINTIQGIIDTYSRAFGLN